MTDNLIDNLIECEPTMFENPLLARAEDGMYEEKYTRQSRESSLCDTLSHDSGFTYPPSLFDTISLESSRFDYTCTVSEDSTFEHNNLAKHWQAQLKMRRLCRMFLALVLGFALAVVAWGASLALRGWWCGGAAPPAAGGGEVLDETAVALRGNGSAPGCSRCCCWAGVAGGALAVAAGVGACVCGAECVALFAKGEAVEAVAPEAGTPEAVAALERMKELEKLEKEKLEKELEWVSKWSGREMEWARMKMEEEEREKRAFQLTAEGAQRLKKLGMIMEVADAGLVVVKRGKEGFVAVKPGTADGIRWGLGVPLHAGEYTRCDEEVEEEEGAARGDQEK